MPSTALTPHQQRIKDAVIAANGVVGAAAAALGMRRTLVSEHLHHGNLFLWWRIYKEERHKEIKRARWRRRYHNVLKHKRAAKEADQKARDAELESYRAAYGTRPTGTPGILLLEE